MAASVWISQRLVSTPACRIQVWTAFHRLVCNRPCGWVTPPASRGCHRLARWLPLGQISPAVRLHSCRGFASHASKSRRSAIIYVAAVFIGMVGATYAAVPLYRLYCQVSGLGGQSTQAISAADKVENLKKVQDRMIEVRFNADTNASMMWNFKPQQSVIKLVPGETALAFYKARNPTDKPITGISTYSVVPFEAGQYFNKIQCFCFEEQRLNPHEEVDMPVFFYIDPEFADDPKLQAVEMITLSYTFFEVKDGMQLPSPPEYARAAH